MLSAKMSWWTILLLLLVVAPCRADNFLEHVTLNNNVPPGYLEIKYNGWKGLAIDEARNQFYNYWGLQARERYEADIITARDYNRTLDDISIAKQYHDIIGRWWDKQWFENGNRVQVQVGRAQDLLNIGPFQINSKFKVKLREYSVSLRRHNESTYWRINFRPDLSFSSRDLISNAEINVVFRYYRYTKQLVEIKNSAGWSRRNGFYLYCTIRLAEF